MFLNKRLKKLTIINFKVVRIFARLNQILIIIYHIIMEILGNIQEIYCILENVAKYCNFLYL